MEYETIGLSVEEGVATLTLQRPESRNAMNAKMAEEIKEALATVAATPQARALILTGAGQAFCSGGDIAAMGEQLAMTLPDRTAELLRFYRSFLAIRDLEIPTIAAINGHAMGAGFTLALACDLRLAAENAKLGLSFVKIGLHPGMGTCYFLARMVGTAKALELLWSGEALSAAEAQRLGLVNRVVDAQAIGEAARALARELAAGPAVALRLIKSTVYQAVEADLNSILEREALAQAISTVTDDFKEGVSAFLEKRAARFQGR